MRTSVVETHSGHLIFEGSPQRFELPLQWSAADVAAALPAPSTIGVSPAAVSAVSASSILSSSLPLGTPTRGTSRRRARSPLRRWRRRRAPRRWARLAADRLAAERQRKVRGGDVCRVQRRRATDADGFGEREAQPADVGGGRDGAIVVVPNPLYRIEGGRSSFSERTSCVVSAAPLRSTMAGRP